MLRCTSASRASEVKTCAAPYSQFASLSPELALRFETAFGVSMDLMLKTQLQYDIARTRKLAKSI
ncbi:MAG: hypothetical protein HC855_04385 [Rhizobiales bacterium]|nr:hypothetical protein [Hyphomicrobiales bacterium]